MCDQVDGEGERISSRQSIVLDLPPSCIEFCPAHPSYLVVGTYNLQKEEQQQQQQGEDENGEEDQKSIKSQSRNGSIIVFQLRDDGKVYPVQTLPQPSAVFDLHFQPPYQGQGRAADICATVSSTGTIALFRLTPPTSPTPATDVLTQLSVLRIPGLGDDTLFTFFAWHPIIAGLMAITTAAGAVVLVRIHDDCQGLDVWDEALLEHDGLEAWCVAFSQAQSQPGLAPGPSPFTIFSGGDDSKLRYALYDAAAAAAAPPTEDGDSGSLINNRIPYPPVSLGNHDAGVTFILPLPVAPNDDGSHLVATGSYDEHLRLWKIAPLDQTGGVRRASLVAEKGLGGGVWRLNTLGVKPGTEASSSSTARPWEVMLLASCMHAGSRIVRVRGTSDEEIQLEILARCEEHKSMNYGSDWFRGGGVAAQGSRLCVSTSFYDRLLCVWTFEDGVGCGTAS